MRQEQACDFAQGLAGVNATDVAAFFTAVVEFTICRMFSTRVYLGACCMPNTDLLIIQNSRLHLGHLKNSVHEQQSVLVQSVKVLSMRFGSCKWSKTWSKAWSKTWSKTWLRAICQSFVTEISWLLLMAWDLVHAGTLGKGLPANDPTLDLLFASPRQLKVFSLRAGVPKLFEPADQFFKALSLRRFFWLWPLGPLVLVNPRCQESLYYDTL